MKSLVTLGSVSSGTMRPEDLIPAFIDLLDDIKERLSLSVRPGEELETTARVSRIDDALADIEQRMQSDDYYESEDCTYDLSETLFYLLDEFAPPLCYFGAHPGDGADFGYWVNWDAIEYDTDDSLLRVDDTADIPVGYTGSVLRVNDHGNATLYDICNGVAEEVWSIV